MRAAIVGCGYVATFYLKTLSLHPEIQIMGVMDHEQKRAKQFSDHFSVPLYSSFDELLEDQLVELVVNLTNPQSHFHVSKACLHAGKHVYSEKPLAMSFSEAKELVDLAEQLGLRISSAPSRVLAETAQTLWKAIREDAVGTVYLTYAEMDDGLIHRMPYDKWKNELGTPWPYKNEFEVGCTLEHGGYIVALLTTLFGPVASVTAFSSVRIVDKETEIPLEAIAPDFSVACLKFISGHVARLTCSIVAPRNHSIRIFGSEGVLRVDDINKPRSRVYVGKTFKLRRRTIFFPWMKKYPMVEPTKTMTRLQKHQNGNRKIDFCLGIADMVQAIQDSRPCRLSASFCLHHDEVVFAIGLAGVFQLP